MKSPVGTPLSLMVSVCTLFALLLVGGCKSEEKGRTASLPPPLVGVMTVEERNVPVSFTYAGQTEGSRAVEVRAQVSGILMRRAYDEGQYVKQGQLLFEIEPDTYRAALRQANGVMEQAQAKFTQARQNLNRVLPLYKKNAVSQKDRDDAQALLLGKLPLGRHSRAEGVVSAHDLPAQALVQTQIGRTVFVLPFHLVLLLSPFLAILICPEYCMLRTKKKQGRILPWQRRKNTARAGSARRRC